MDNSNGTEHALRDGIIVSLSLLVAIGGFLAPELSWVLAGC